MPPSSVIKIVIAYETATIAVRAKAMAEQVAAEMQCECDSWEMELLAEPIPCRQAAAAAAEAHMIIIAARGAGELPRHVRDWIETWLPWKKAGPTALVVLLDEEGETLAKPPPFCVYLREVAERGNMDFFCNASQWTLRDFHHADPWPRTVESTESSRAVPMGWNVESMIMSRLQYWQDMPNAIESVTRSESGSVWPSGPVQPMTNSDMKTLTLGKRTPEDQPAGSAPPSPRLPPANSLTHAVRGGETVLVVDDEQIVREVVVYTLRKLGYRVMEASGSVEAQQLANASGKIHLLVTDFSMPEINGLELARWFQSRYPETGVLIATGSLWEFLSQSGEQEQFAVLAKPFDGAQLGRMVRLVLDEVRLKQRQSMTA